MMTTLRRFRIPRMISFLIVVSFVALPVHAKYSGGSGTAQDPYQIATAADLIALGETPADYDKHFILTADIDLDPNLPGRKVFDRAVIGVFTGIFDGNGRTISHLTIKEAKGWGYLGLFSSLRSGAEVRGLGVVDASITGWGDHVGGLVGWNDGAVTQCYSTGAIESHRLIGAASGGFYVGGLVGYNHAGTVSQCYSTGAVSGSSYVGGLVGGNHGVVNDCYSTGAVGGTGWEVGGLVGSNGGSVTQCYSTGAVAGNAFFGSVGGLVGGGDVLHCVWDTETSGMVESAGGVGLTTGEMMDPYMLGLNGFANDPNWVLYAGRDYPRLAWEGTPGQIIPAPRVDWLQGHGTAEDPYRIEKAEQLIFLGRASALCDGYFFLAADIDLDPSLPGRQPFRRAVIPTFAGIFDAYGHTISHLTIQGGGYVGLFGQLASGAEVKALGVVDVNIVGLGQSIGGLVGVNNSGTVTQCYSTGAVTGSGYDVGGLVGANYGTVTHCHSTAAVTSTNSNVGGLVGANEHGAVTQCYSTGAVSGKDCVGGLVGIDSSGSGRGTVTHCYSTGAVRGTGESVGGLVGCIWGKATRCYSTGVVGGELSVGGLVGANYGTLTQCYSTGAVSGISLVGGLVGGNATEWGTVTYCYSSGAVSGVSDVGGLVGGGYGEVFHSVWDMETAAQSASAGGVGLTTAEMMDPNMLGLNGFASDPNWVLDVGHDYPKLAWQNTPGEIIAEPDIDGLEGSGPAEAPYRIDTADQLILLGKASILWDKHFVLGADIDLDPKLPGRQVFGQAVIPTLAGVLDGHGHTISHLSIRGGRCLGLVGEVGPGAEVKDLGVVDVNITGSGDDVGGLVGSNFGAVTRCYSTGVVSGTSDVGGLVGRNDASYPGAGTVTNCYSTGTVSGTGQYVGGLMGSNGGYYSPLHGLLACGTVTECYSTGAVRGGSSVGGLVGWNGGTVTACFWDTRTSGQTKSAGGVGKTTAQMQTAKTFLDAGWDFVGETANGAEDIWSIDEGKTYPQLWWEARN